VRNDHRYAFSDEFGYRVKPYTSAIIWLFVQPRKQKPEARSRQTITAIWNLGDGQSQDGVAPGTTSKSLCEAEVRARVRLTKSGNALRRRSRSR